MVRGVMPATVQQSAPGMQSGDDEYAATVVESTVGAIVVASTVGVIGPCFVVRPRASAAKACALSPSSIP